MKIAKKKMRDEKKHLNKAYGKPSELRVKQLQALDPDCDMDAYVNNEEYSHLDLNAVDGMEHLIQLTSAEIDTYAVDPQVKADYEAKRAALVEVQADLEAKISEGKELREEFEATRTQWISQIETIVVGLNKTFGREYERMGIAGEVRLYKGDEEDTRGGGAGRQKKVSRKSEPFLNPHSMVVCI